MHVLHAIHDFLPKHQAGSEIYAASLCVALAARHHTTVVAAEYDPSRTHGHVSWRRHDVVPVIEIVNNYRAATFAEAYRDPLIGRRLTHVLDVVRPDVLHVHNLLNLSFDLPALAHARGIPIVATLHDYTLVCPSGGQRVHRAESHVCHTIDPDRCARCFRQSPIYGEMTVAAASAMVPGPKAVAGAARWLTRAWPAAARGARAAVAHVAPIAVGADDIRARLDAAREVFDAIDLFVSPSASLAREYIALGVDARKMLVSDYGFRPLAAAVRRPAPRRPLRFGFVGSIVWHKGVHVLVEAARLLTPGSYEVLIFGDPGVAPDYAADLRRRAAGLAVEFRGGFDAASAARVYGEFDVLVVPSIWLENSPLVMHEAFMSGMPVVGARMGGIVDLVRHGENGLLYDATSPEALAAAMRDLIDAPDRVTALAARAPAVKTIEEDAAEWEARYARVLGADGRDA